MHGLRTMALTGLALLGGLALGGPGTALAGDDGYGYGHQGHRGHHAHDGHVHRQRTHRGCLPAPGACGTVLDCAPSVTPACGCTGYAPYATGSSWATIRYHMTGKELIRSFYLRNYFLRRHPFAPRRQGRYSRLLDNNLRGGLVYADDPEAADAVPVDALDYLNRGMARFFFKDYDLARADFEAALARDPALHPARYGTLLTAVVRSEWSRAARILDTMAEHGELRADDRLLAAETFRDDRALAAIVDGVRSYVRYKALDSRAHLVAAWALTASGRTDEAASHLRRAARGGDRPALRALGGEPTVTPESTITPQPTPTPRPATAPAPSGVPSDIRAPASVLQPVAERSAG